MHAAYRRTSATHRLLPLSVDSEGTAVVLPLARPLEGGSGYGADRRPNWPVIGILLAVHAALLAALISYDVIPVGVVKSKPIVVELIDVPPVAPPAPVEIVEPEQVQPQVVAPVPLVEQPVAPPPVIAVAPPPRVETPVAASKPVEAAPVTPPDFSADYLNNPPPRYPVESRRLREQGTVTIKVLVTQDGGVQELKLAESSGHERLDKAALAAVRNWRFAPARQAGKPVAAWVIVPIPFILRG